MFVKPRSSSVAHDRCRIATALVAILALTAGCGGSPATIAPSAALSPAASASAAAKIMPTSTATATPGASVPPSAPAVPSPTPAPASSAQVGGAGPWQPAGSMLVARAQPHAIRLPDGRVLVVGNDGKNASGVRDDSATAELWDPSTNTWRATASLNRPRAGFAAVALADGRVLVTGGLDGGAPAIGSDPSTSCMGPNPASYSSTYLYDPRSGHETWSRTGLLGTARTDPAIAVLSDGRVLVAGGYYEFAARSLTGDATLVDIGPDFIVPPLATAELFDPSTGTWSPSGPMHYARYGAAAATLADGRVLVVGTSQGAFVSGNGAVMASDSASDSAEIYDPRTGRFTTTGALPDQGQRSGASSETAGTLVPLSDGGALLVGNDREWKHGGSDTRSFRYDVRTGTWAEVGRAFIVAWPPNGAALTETAGVGGRVNAMAARLPDGRVLVAGGDLFVQSGPDVSRSAALYDPGTNRWSVPPPLPGPRAGGAAVALQDGSVLLVGGYGDLTSAWATCNEPQGLASTLRFVPAP